MDELYNKILSTIEMNGDDIEKAATELKKMKISRFQARQIYNKYSDDIRLKSLEDSTDIYDNWLEIFSYVWKISFPPLTFDIETYEDKVLFLDTEIKGLTKNWKNPFGIIVPGLDSDRQEALRLMDILGNTIVSLEQVLQI